MTKCGHPCSYRNIKPPAGGQFLLGAVIALPFLGLLSGCGARDEFGSGATVAVDTAALPTTDTASIETSVRTTPSQTGSTVAPATTAVVDEAPTTTAMVVAYPPLTMAPPPVITDASVQALADVLGVEGELEQRDGEHGAGQCVGRLEPRGLCVNVPLWGLWQYWDLSAQEGPGASDEQASSVAVFLFARLGVYPGVVTSIEPNGPLPQVKFSSGALVMVAADDRIAMVIAGTNLVPSV